MWKMPIAWPSRALSPNARVHWSKRSAAVKRARGEAKVIAQAMGCRALQIGPGQALRVSTTVHPPDNRQRDLDNIFSALKATRDGIADASHVDDSRWQIGPLKWGEVRKGGAIEMIVEVVNDA